MNKRLILFFIAGCFFFQPSISSAAKTTFGEPDCGQWVKDNQRMRSLDEAWLLGFLTGLNLSSSPYYEKDFLKSSSAAQLFLWMDNYCQKNPLKDISQGAIELGLELNAKK
jgi:hypothetical protein